MYRLVSTFALHGFRASPKSRVTNEMGIRLNMGAGYGIIVTKKQIGALGGTDYIEQTMEKYFDERIGKAWDITRKKRDDVLDGKSNDDLDGITSLLHYQKYIDADESKKRNKLVIKHGGANACFREEFIYPAEEYGARSFIGFINDPVHDNDVMYAMLHAFNKLGFKTDIGHPFEFHVPVHGASPLSIQNDVSSIPMRNDVPVDDKRPKFVPEPGIIASGLGKDYFKILKDAADKGTALPFQTESECNEYVSTWLKEWNGIMSVFYRRGLELVRIIFPETRMKDIERYVVAWWA